VVYFKTTIVRPHIHISFIGLLRGPKQWSPVIQGIFTCFFVSFFDNGRRAFSTSSFFASSLSSLSLASLLLLLLSSISLKPSSSYTSPEKKWKIFYADYLTLKKESQWGSSLNWLEPKTKPPLRNLACPNP